MRLSKIKLVGFKSFVDPTTVNLPSNLAGVVGPNGCGKSNIIDAIRWVMGESSAKYLRGESMTDVIFNGSLARNPVGMASIELIFDNSDATIKGAYAQYNEISVKRQVNREAQSTYFLNGARCRKKDISDIFLGTGLGPRSYSIIEQGMISRLIEAKPLELRVYIEEAAGISKYKERRRETENRIKHTRENLARLTDLRDELEKQLNHLHRQSQAAERYKVLKDEERHTEAQLHAIRFVSTRDKQQNLAAQITEQEIELARHNAAITHAETASEEHRDEQATLQDQHDEIQRQFYGIGNEITRLEQTLQHRKERQDQLTRDLKELDEQLNEAQLALLDDQKNHAEFTITIETVTPQFEESKSIYESSAEMLSDKESAMQSWQESWDEFNHRAAQSQKIAEVEQTRMQHLDQKRDELSKRIDKLNDELRRLSDSTVEKEIAVLTEELSQREIDLESSNVMLTSLFENIREHRCSIDDVQASLNKQQQSLQGLLGREASLQALQQAALGQSDEENNQWLERQGLKENKRLAQLITVNKGWERAVEVVLGDYLEAVCLDSQTDDLYAAIRTCDSGKINFVEASVSINLSDTQDNNNPDSISHSTRKNIDSIESDSAAINSSSVISNDLLLSNQVSGEQVAKSLLSTVYIAEDLQEALGMRDKLNSYESVITKDGLWLGPQWIRVSPVINCEESESGASQGVIAREKAINEIADDIESARQSILSLQEQLHESQEKLVEAEQQREQQQQLCNDQQSQLSDVRAQHRVKQGRLEQLQRRIEQLSKEKSDCQDSIAGIDQPMSEAQKAWNEAMEIMDSDADKRSELQSQREIFHGELIEVREKVSNDRESLHQSEMQIQTAQNQLTYLNQSIARLEQQVSTQQQRKQQLSESLNVEDALSQLQDDLTEQLEKRVSVESNLQNVRSQLEEINHKMSQFTEDRHQAESASIKTREALANLQISIQEFKVRQQTAEEYLQEAGFELKEVCDNLPDDANEPAWRENLEGLARRISRLGAINLAAIDEYAEQSKRKVYLDEQNDDLEKALTTLEDAISKIDRETRQRFKATFDEVNSFFSQYFPKIFGGGSAKLELTDDDLLEAGVTVIARPPGKKNATVHLLSGGEKALTAIALVFSIFQLNPSPFCLLDEVDAPLDDANVARYCDLVKDMSQKVQFIFISHNKVAISMAEQLIGVTMNEPGVSRLVSVDVDEAVALASV